MRKIGVLALIAVCFTVISCDRSRIPGWWATYKHPSYKFTMKHPRGWKIEEGGTFGALLTILPPEDDSLFRANANLVVEKRDEKTSLKVLSDRSQIQLGKLLQDYRPLANVPTKMGNIEAVELRGKYKASEGDRIMRTWIGYTSDLVYVFTFTCRAVHEQDHVDEIDALLSSMFIPTT